jgi:signal transduction histidine kinase
VVNLVVNAIQAMAEQESSLAIRIRCQSDRTRGVAILSVTDFGPGVADDLRERIFQPFFSTKGSGGSGIGLALCRRIVTTHGGRIRVEAAPLSSGMAGATFVVELPLHQPEASLDHTAGGPAR